MKDKVCKFLFDNYPIIQLTCNVYNNLVSLYLDAGFSIPPAILDIYHVAKTITHLVNEALQISPIDIDAERYDLMRQVLLDSKWGNLSFLECTKKYSIDKNTFYRSRKIAYKNTISMMNLLFDKYFVLLPIENCSEKELQEASAVLLLSNEVCRLSNNDTLKKRLYSASSTEEVLSLFRENIIYSNFTESAIIEIRKIVPYGYNYSVIVSKLIKNESRKSKRSFIYGLSLNTFKGLRYRRVLKMVNDAMYYMSIIMFGVNSSLLNDGVFLRLVKNK